MSRVRSFILRLALVIAALTVLVSLNPLREADAAVPANTVYRGAMSDGGVATITTDPTAARITAAYNFGGSIPSACPTGVSQMISMAPNGLQFAAVGGSTASLANLTMGGVVDTNPYKTMVGLVTSDSPAGSTCPKHRATWVAAAADLPSPAPVLPGNSTYAGNAFIIGSNQPAGTVSVVTLSDGSMQLFTMSVVRDACTYCSRAGRWARRSGSRAPSCATATPVVRAWSRFLPRPGSVESR